ncbi:MAG TPA: DNA primase [Candidatus Paceibacterota bacterium]
MSDSVQQIKDRLNIVDVVGQYVKLQKAGRNYRATCPFHKERTPSFYVSPERGTYTCFGCGEKGDIFSFVEKMDGIDFKTALRQLGEKAGVEVKFSRTAESTPEHKEHDERLRDVCEEATKFFEAELAKRSDVLEYLGKRAVSDETRSGWRIGYAPAAWHALSEHLENKGFSKNDIVDSGLSLRSEKKTGEIYDRFRGRIMFPIGDSAGRIIAFSGRHFEDMPGARDEGDAAKYVNSPETDLFKKSRVLYGFDKAKESIRKTDCVMLVEGQFDVILSHQAGLPFAVAVSGTALTEEHLTMLGRMSKRLVLALDNDKAGLKAGLRSAAMAYAQGFDVKVPTIVGEAKDPADLVGQDPALWRHAVRDAKSAIEFFVEALRPYAKDERAYKKLVEQQVLPLVAAMHSKIDQAHFTHVIADALHVPDDAVRFEVERIAKHNAAHKDTHTADEREEEKKASFMVSEVEPPSLERAAGMLLFYPDTPEGIVQKLEELLGAERCNMIKTKLEYVAERLRFEFDALGMDAAVSAETLLTIIDRMILEERIAQVRADLSYAAQAGDAARISELNKTLTELTRKKHS